MPKRHLNLFLNRRFREQKKKFSDSGNNFKDLLSQVKMISITHSSALNILTVSLNKMTIRKVTGNINLSAG
jgi:hypothetical protein